MFYSQCHFIRFNFNALLNVYHQGYIVCNLFFLIFFIFYCVYHIHREKKKKLNMRVVAMSVSDVVTTSLYDVAETLPRRCYNVTKTSTNGCVGAF